MRAIMSIVKQNILLALVIIDVQCSMYIRSCRKEYIRLDANCILHDTMDSH